MTTPTQSEDYDPDAFRAAVMSELLGHDIAQVTIEFDGGSDEGQVERIRCEKLDGSEGSLEFATNIPGKVVPAGTRAWDSATLRYVTEPVERPATMAEVLDGWSYELLDTTGVDWVNNEGGFGEIVITPATNAIHCDMNVRFIDSEAGRHEL
jgi:hypothetical protein